MTLNRQAAAEYIYSFAELSKHLSTMSIHLPRPSIFLEGRHNYLGHEDTSMISFLLKPLESTSVFLSSVSHKSEWS
jgi:hypothetical protein